MSDNFWKILSYLCGLFLLAALFVVVFFTAHVELKDLDLWLHLAVGRFITQNGFVPTTDILTCSLAGQPWINHEWFFQIIIYNVFDTWGPNGVIYLQVGLVLVTMLLLLILGYNKDRQLLTVLSLFLVLMVYQQRFTTRPDLFSLLFFTMYIFVLALHIDKKWAPLSLFFVQILWTNMHGFFFFGPLFVLIGLISETMKRYMKLPYEWNDSGRLTDDEFSRLKVTFFLVVIACFLNPYFVKGAWYPIGVFFSLSGENKIFFEYIQELHVPITWANIFNASQQAYYKIIILVSFISFIFNRRRIDISALFFWLVFLIFSLKAVRNTPFFAFAAYLVLITNSLYITFDDIVPLRFTGQRFKHLTAAVLKVLLVILIYYSFRGVVGRGYYDFDKYEMKSENEGISLRNYPTKGADFLEENKITGNFFNDFNSGAYLLGRLHPHIRVFIDGRTELQGGKFFLRYRDIWERGDSKLFEEVAKKYQFTGAFLNAARQYIPKKILNYLYQHEDWILVYFNYDAAIFLKDIPANQAWIKEHRISLKKWEPVRLDLYRIGSSRIDPYHNYFRAFTLESMDFDDAALEEARAALEINPSYAKSYELIGKIYSKREDHEESFRNFRVAATIKPSDKNLRYNLGLSLMDLQKYPEAIKEYQEISKIWPKDPKAAFLLSKAYVQNQQFDEGLNILRHAHQMDPQDAMDIILIADLIFEAKEYEKAKEAYQLAFETKRDLHVIHKKFGDLFEAMGDPVKAGQAYNMARQLEPKEKPEEEPVGKYLNATQ